MTSWHRVDGELDVGRGRTVVINGRTIALTRCGGRHGHSNPAPRRHRYRRAPRRGARRREELYAVDDPALLHADAELV